MEQTVYIDLFFLINFSMDFLGLFIAAKLLCRKRRLLRLVLAAIFGGAYACFALVVPMQSYLSLFSLLVDALACVIMALIAVFDRKTLRGVFSFAIVYGAISILLGGAMTALFSVFNRLGLDKLFASDGVEGDGISVYIFAIFAALSGLATLLGGRFFKKKSLRQGGTVEIEYRGRRVSLNCICDSGNLLREPISQAPCILVELDALRGLFSDSFLRAVGNGRIEELSPLESSRIRMIPAKDVSGSTLLVGVRPDRIIVDMGKGGVHIEAYLALSNQKISANGAKALIPSEIAMCAV